MSAEGTAHQEATRQSCGASPGEGKLPGVCPAAPKDCAATLGRGVCPAGCPLVTRGRAAAPGERALSAECAVPGLSASGAPSSLAVLNEHPAAPLCPAMAAKAPESTGCCAAVPSAAPCSALLAETATTAQEQRGLSMERAAADPEGGEMSCCRVTLNRHSATLLCPAATAGTPEAALGSSREALCPCSRCKAPSCHHCEMPCSCRTVPGHGAGFAAPPPGLPYQLRSQKQCPAPVRFQLLCAMWLPL